MWTGIASAGIGALVGGLSSIGAKKRQKDLMDYQAQLQYEYGERAAENAYQRQIDAWNMQNEYNTPEAQRQRLEQAGLHGASLFAGASPGEASQLPSVGMGATGSGSSLQLQSNPVMTSVLQGIQVAQALANLDLTRSQSDKNKAQTATEAYKQASMQADVALKKVYRQHEGVKMAVTEINESILQATEQAQIDAAWLNTAQGRLSIKTSEQNLLNLAEQYEALQNKNELFPLEKQQAQLQLSQMAQQIACNKALEDFYRARTDLTNYEKQVIAAQVQEIFSRIDLNRSQYNLNFSSKRLNDQLAGESRERTGLLGKQSEAFGRESWMHVITGYGNMAASIIQGVSSAVTAGKMK